jgi:hypothetical protein
MSQVPRRARVRQFASTVWPGREADGHANLVAARLLKLAATGSTGMLPVSGPGEGAIFLRDGQVAYAESTRTTARRAGSPAGPGPTPQQASPPPPVGAELAVASPISRLSGLLALTEPTIDAATELLSGNSRSGRFRQADAPPPAGWQPIPVQALLTEAGRRHRVLAQLAAVVTADTPVVRNASVPWPSLQVSPPQWALVVAIGDEATPRSLAMELGRSVFATTIEVYRLIVLGLLAIAEQAHAEQAQPGRARPGQARPGQARPGQARPSGGGQDKLMSFIRAVSDERGSHA